MIDEFPFLVKASPGLPSIIQRELGPGGTGAASRARLLLCGSAMSVITRSEPIPECSAPRQRKSGPEWSPTQPNRTQIQIDVAVFGPAEPGEPRKILSRGEVKWDRIMQQRHVQRLRRARDLLAVKGFDTRDTVFACYSGAGFHPDLQADRADDTRLIGLDQLYAD